MQIRQRIFKCFTMQICRLFFTAFWNFWRITHLSTNNHRWVTNAQTGLVFFGPLCSITAGVHYASIKLNTFKRWLTNFTKLRLVLLFEEHYHTRHKNALALELASCYQEPLSSEVCKWNEHRAQQRSTTPGPTLQRPITVQSTNKWICLVQRQLLLNTTEPNT